MNGWCDSSAASQPRRLQLHEPGRKKLKKRITSRPLENEPNRNFVWFPGLASIMGQPSSLLSGCPPQSRKLG